MTRCELITELLKPMIDEEDLGYDADAEEDCEPITIRCYNIVWDSERPEDDVQDEVIMEDIDWTNYGDELNDDVIEEIIYNEMEHYSSWLYCSCDYEILKK